MRFSQNRSKQFDIYHYFMFYKASLIFKNFLMSTAHANGKDPEP